MGKFWHFFWIYFSHHSFSSVSECGQDLHLNSRSKHIKINYSKYNSKWFRDFEDFEQIYYKAFCVKYIQALIIMKKRRQCSLQVCLVLYFTVSKLWFDSIFMPSILVTGGPYVCEMSLWLSWANAVLLHMRPEIINTLSDILRAPLCYSNYREGLLLCLGQRWSHQPHIPKSSLLKARVTTIQF